MYLENLDKDKYVLIEADNSNYQYMGRIDFETKKLQLLFMLNDMRTKFTGTSLKIAINNNGGGYESSIGFIIDGNISGKVVIEEHGKDIILDIADNLSEGIHDLVLYKRAAACHYFDFYGVILEKGCHLEMPEAKSSRRIECFGDSVSAGEVSEAIDYVGKIDPEGHEGTLSNSWYSYS